MEALGHRLSNALTISPSNPRRQSANRWARSRPLCSPRPPSAIPQRGFPPHFHKQTATVRMGAPIGGEEEEVKQAKEMAAARRRWEALIREQKVKTLTPKEAGYAIQLSNKTLLDVRPSTEHNKAWVRGSTWIPIFDVDGMVGFGGLSKRITSFAMETNGVTFVLIIVLSLSLAACEQLYNAGFQNLFWVQGGFEAAKEEDFQREGPQPFKLAGIGGVSEFLGWTDQQRAVAAKEGWGYQLVFTGRLIGLVLVADALFLGAQQVGPFLQELRSH